MRISPRRRIADCAELEPGSVIHTLKSFWEERQIGKTPKEIEKFMVEALSKALKREISLSQYRLLFGDGQRQQLAKMVMPRDIAKAYFRILFENWPSERGEANDNGTILPFLREKKLKTNDFAKQLSDQLYAPGYPVYCRPAEYIGVKGYLYYCSKKGYSTICSSRGVPPRIVYDPVIGLIDWIEDMQAFFSESLDKDTLFIWAMREPVISSFDARTIRELHNIDALKSALKTLKTMCLSNAIPLPWDKIAKRLVLAVYTERQNDSLRADQSRSFKAEGINSVPDSEIFFSDIPSEWTQNLDPAFANNMSFATTVMHDKDDRIAYNTYHPHESYQRGPLFISQKSPGKQKDRAFTNLFEACHELTGTERSFNSADILQVAQSHGWLFMTAEEYIKWDIL